ncbi:hypothetical protein J1614_006805 [Plenodomus biglobosus]|nr:hypothetical protein J1614_006805 [Plenodomus biglobosus]
MGSIDFSWKNEDEDERGLTRGCGIIEQAFLVDFDATDVSGSTWSGVAIALGRAIGVGDGLSDA